MEARSERRCKGLNKLGEPCRSTFVGPDGYCSVHTPTNPLDMREMGRRGGSVRPSRNGSENLRDYLRREVSPARVWAALEEAMQGKNESARVAAVKVLAQELYEPEREREQGWGAAVTEARAQLVDRIQRHAAAQDRDLRLNAREWAARMIDALETEPPAYDTQAVLSELFELGWLRPGPNWPGPTIEAAPDA